MSLLVERDTCISLSLSLSHGKWMDGWMDRWTKSQQANSLAEPQHRQLRQLKPRPARHDKVRPDTGQVEDLPQPAGGLVSRSSGRTARATRYTPKTLTSHPRFHSAGSLALEDRPEGLGREEAGVCWRGCRAGRSARALEFGCGRAAMLRRSVM